MSYILRFAPCLLCLFTAFSARAQPYFLSTATVSGNSIVYKVKAVNSSITCGWSDIEFFFRNSNGAPNADLYFSSATITVNTTNFPGVTISYNGINIQGTETGYNTYWLGTSFTPTTPQTYNQGQEYILCTITLSTSPSNFGFEMVHNEPWYSPHYVVLTDQNGEDQTNLTGTCKFYGPGATICEPLNCPVTTFGNNHILPLAGAAPVELADFQAKKAGTHTARLDWQTNSEIGFVAFEVERLENAVWNPIGEVNAAAQPGTGAHYTFYDRDAPGDIAYYRLKMIDRDGSFAYSPVRSVQFDADAAMQIFPNPAADVLQLAFGSGMAEGMLQVELYDWSGRLVVQRSITAVPGMSETIRLREYRLPAGVYLVKAGMANGFSFSQSLLIQPGG